MPLMPMSSNLCLDLDVDADEAADKSIAMDEGIVEGVEESEEDMKRQQRRRQTAYAKHRRMSLMNAATLGDGPGLGKIWAQILKCFTCRDKELFDGFDFFSD